MQLEILIHRDEVRSGAGSAYLSQTPSPVGIVYRRRDRLAPLLVAGLNRAVWPAEAEEWPPKTGSGADAYYINRKMAESEPPSRDIREGTLMSTLWSVKYQREDGDTKEHLWISAAEPKSMARADFEAARIDAQRLARALLEHKVGKVVILSCRWILAPSRAARRPPAAEIADSG
jgi:hypothetical protein